MTAEISHGRGGAGNIVADSTEYTDGEIVRVGAEGSHGDGPFGTGRGGAGNVADTGVRPSTERKDRMDVPTAAVRASSEHTDYHTGRGGAGNEHVSEDDKKPALNPDGTPISLADKLKSKLFGVFKK